MQRTAPDFFLGSSEHRGDWATARSCHVLKRLVFFDGRDSVIVLIDPPVIGQTFGLGGTDIFNLLLVARWKHTSFSEPIHFPMPVHIYRFLDASGLAKDDFHESDVELSAWGEIYPTLQAA